MLYAVLVYRADADRLRPVFADVNVHGVDLRGRFAWWLWLRKARLVGHTRAVSEDSPPSLSQIFSASRWDWVPRVLQPTEAVALSGGHNFVCVGVFASARQSEERGDDEITRHREETCARIWLAGFWEKVKALPDDGSDAWKDAWKQTCDYHHSLNRIQMDLGDTLDSAHAVVRVLLATGATLAVLEQKSEELIGASESWRNGRGSGYQRWWWRFAGACRCYTGGWQRLTALWAQRVSGRRFRTATG